MDDQTKQRLTTPTLVARALGAHEPTTNAVIPPIHMSATFLRDPDNGYRSGYVYGRTDNLSVQQAESLIAALEGADEALLFGSGMAAATAVLLALERPTHIIASQVMYWGFRSWLREIGQYGHRISFVDTSDLDAVRAAVRPGETGLFWIETPSNPLWTITDIAAIADIAHGVDAVLCVDSTVATPIFTRPLQLGADIVMHSATKYLNGHSDIIAGALAAAGGTRLWSRIRKMRTQLGSALVRLRRLAVDARHAHARSARAPAGADRGDARGAARRTSRRLRRALSRPRASCRPRRRRAADARAASAACFRVRIGNGEAAAIAVAAAVELWKRATSFGGTESLIEHRASIEGAGSPCPGDLLRFSAGLEDADELYIDLIRALAVGAS